MLTRDSLFSEEHTQTESKEMRKDTSGKCWSKETKHDYMCIRQNRLSQKLLKRNKQGHYVMIRGQFIKKI
jgi:hypothetical protein